MERKNLSSNELISIPYLLLMRLFSLHAFLNANANFQITQYKRAFEGHFKIFTFCLALMKKMHSA
jgi:hypothetical protein